VTEHAVYPLEPPASRLGYLTGELRKLPAFIRRDFLVALSYRMAFVADLVNLMGQVLVFYFIGRMIDASELPRFGGAEVTYLEFTSIGIALSAFIYVGMERVSAAMRGEQLMGTLESLLITPTASATIQLGSVVFDLVYVPLRTGLFLVAIALTFGLHFDGGGILPAAVTLLVFIPFVWGLGVASAAMILTFRRGAGTVGFGLIGLALVSGVYFPLSLLPDWIATVSRHNPVALVTEGMREALLGGEGWAAVGPEILFLVPMSLVTLAAGLVLFRVAVRRELRRGTLGLY
jgi:ABC-2 type transport system permease protein